MALTTYAELVAALDGTTGYLHRGDLTAKIPDFIKLAESKINRKLKLLLQEAEATLTAVVGSRLMAVPTRFGTPIALWCTTYPPRKEVIFRDSADLPVTDTSSASDYYTVDGAYIATENPADIAYTYTLRYLTRFDLATTLTNVVLSDYPDVYLYGTLLASVSYTGDQSNAQTWNGLYENALKEAVTHTIATKGKAMLRTDFGAARSNILRGD